jgi:drug/metabolite transporter (DMT)-like permease
MSSAIPFWPPRVASFIARPALAMLLLNVLWSIALVASKVGIDEFSPMLFGTLRFFLFALPLTPFLRWHRGSMSKLLCIALLAGGLTFALLCAGIRYSGNISASAVTTQLTVPFTTLLSIWLLQEVVHWRRWAGIAVSLAGFVVLGFDPHLLDHRVGLLLVTMSSFVGALGLILIKKYGCNLHPLQLQALIAWTGLAVMLGLAIALEPDLKAALPSADYRGWCAVFITAWLGNLAGHTGFYFLVRAHPVTRLAPLNVVSPVLSMVLGTLVLGDRLTSRGIAGAVLVLTGVLIISLRDHRMVDIPT